MCKQLKREQKVGELEQGFEFDIILGSVPCQGFSDGGRKAAIKSALGDSGNA